MPAANEADSRIRAGSPGDAADPRARVVQDRIATPALVRDDIGVLDDDVIVIAEEFGQWEDARRRIDLLAVDKSGCLVVIELKRDDGAHMDLQALRYAAMVSSMNFGDVVVAILVAAEFGRELGTSVI